MGALFSRLLRQDENLNTEISDKYLESWINPDQNFHPNKWLVYLICSTNHPIKNHGYILLEAISADSEEHKYLRIELLKEARNPISSIVGSRAIIRCHEPNNCRICIAKGKLPWEITKEQKDKLLARVQQELVIDDRTYSSAGNGYTWSTSLSSDNYGNCASWAMKMLEEELGIQTGSRWESFQLPMFFLNYNGPGPENSVDM